MLVGIGLFFGFILGGMASMLTNLDSQRARYIHHLNVIKDHMVCYIISGGTEYGRWNLSFQLNICRLPIVISSANHFSAFSINVEDLRSLPSSDFLKFAKYSDDVGSGVSMHLRQIPISARCHMWVQFVVGCPLASRVFLHVLPFSSLHKSQNLPKFKFDQDRGPA